MGEMFDKAKGAVNQGVGKAKEVLGDATNNQRLETEGELQQAKGAVQKAAGAVKGAMGDKV